MKNQNSEISQSSAHLMQSLMIEHNIKASINNDKLYNMLLRSRQLGIYNKVNIRTKFSG